MAKSPKNPSSETTISRAALDRPEPTPMPSASFSPQALSNLLNELSAQRAELAAIKAEMVEAAKRKLDATAGKPGPTMSVAGKTDKAIKNEIETVRLFKRAGFQNVVPHVNVKTFNLWVKENRRPIEGSKSIKVNNLRLFHVTQTREITSAEKKANAKQQADAVKRHDAKGNGKTSNVTPLNPQ